MTAQIRKCGVHVTLLGVAAALATSSAVAQSTYFIEYGKSVLRVGAQGTGYYVIFAEPLGQSCQYGTVYLTPDRKGMFALLLAAKLANKRITRLDYSQPAGNGTPCTVEIAELAD